MKKKYFIYFLFAIPSFTNAQSTTPTVKATIIQQTPICNIGDCTFLTAQFTNLQQTTDYIVEQNLQTTPHPFSGGTLISVPEIGLRQDDYWSPILSLPFDFNFYGQTYRSLQMGTNGLITFNATHNFGEFCNWISGIDKTLPNASLYPNSIYGVYQDTDFSARPTTSSINYYILDTGEYAAPNRAFVFNIDNIPNWPMGTTGGLQTSQIVLHETTNFIEVNVLRRAPGSQWGGAGLIGIQNSDATKFLTPEGRNTGAWSATNENWLFKPSGAALPTNVTWYKNGNIIGLGQTVSVCPTQISTDYSMNVDFTLSDGSILSITDGYNLNIGTLNVAQPNDLIFCQNESTINLTVNEAVVLAGHAPSDLEIVFYSNILDAINNQYENRIISPQNFIFNGTEQTIYMRIDDLSGTGCSAIKQFQIRSQSFSVPTGNPIQYFTSGQTVNNLVVSEPNILWCDAAASGNLLPETTILQNGITYFAENAAASDCQSKQTLVERFAVTAYDSALANQTFNEKNLAVYPNPTNGILTISYSENLSKVDIYNAFGQLVLSKNSTAKELKLDVSNLANGLYFAQITSENSNTTVKVLKK